MKWTIEKDYRDNDRLRHSFNELAKETFGLDFEDWYRNGFWGDDYNPYSVVADGKVIANVSVNQTDMRLSGAGAAASQDGNIRHFLQLGTVMTDKAYRNQGFIRKIMERIGEDYGGGTDGIYLFANDSVLNFYPKFGFEKSEEYRYCRRVENTGKWEMEAVRMDNTAAWKRLRAVMDKNVFRGRFDLVNNYGLTMFYVTKFMQENVFYHKETDTFVIAKTEGEKVLVHNVFSGTLKDLDRVTELFGEKVKEVTLGFTPVEKEKYLVTRHCEEDCTFFIKGAGMKVVEEEKLRIPSLAHA
ncbi:GNAT family N-acetyltransferase [bacterium 1xD8-48]|nr:GNAT family N-acetyltransferase [bacterium 1xD8-48]